MRAAIVSFDGCGSLPAYHQWLMSWSKTLSSSGVRSSLACPQSRMVGTMLWPRSITASDHLSFDFALSVLPSVASSMTLDGAAAGGSAAAADGLIGVVSMMPKMNTRPLLNKGQHDLWGGDFASPVGYP